jgi:predicted enzyme related to lactoylglutathione lyase
LPRPVHFEIPSDNPERAITFYSEIFGWKFEKWAGPMEYWMINTGDPSEPGINGGMLRRRDPNQPCVNTITVSNLDETVKAVEGRGGKCVVPKMPVPGVGWLAYFKDLDGFIFGCMQPDSGAGS